MICIPIPRMVCGQWLGETIPAYVYMAENGEWVDTGNLTDGIDINLNDTEIVVLMK